MGYGGSRPDAGRRVGKNSRWRDRRRHQRRSPRPGHRLPASQEICPGNTVGVDKVREFAGSLVERGAAKGVFVTTSQFALAATTYAERIPQRLILIDGDELTRLMVQYGVGVRVERKIEFCKLDLDYFEEESVAE
jgi:restriction system protein